MYIQADKTFLELNLMLQVVKDYFNAHHDGTMTDIVWSTAVSATAVGGCIGAIFGPTVANLFGRYS